MVSTPDRGRELSEAEVREALASARTLGKDPVRLSLLLERMLTTIDLHGRRVQGLRDSMESLMESRKPTGVIEDVLAVLREMPEDKRDQVLGFHVSERVAMAEKAEADAQRAKIAARSETNRARFALAKVANDLEIPVDVRRRVEEVLKALPAGAGLESKISRTEALAQNMPGSFLPPGSPAPAGPVARADAPMRAELPAEYQVPGTGPQPRALPEAEEHELSSLFLQGPATQELGAPEETGSTRPGAQVPAPAPEIEAAPRHDEAEPSESSTSPETSGGSDDEPGGDKDS